MTETLHLRLRAPYFYPDKSGFCTKFEREGAGNIEETHEIRIEFGQGGFERTIPYRVEPGKMDLLDQAA